MTSKRGEVMCPVKFFIMLNDTEPWFLHRWIKNKDPLKFFFAKLYAQVTTGSLGAYLAII
jgi:hypothetical protein